VRASAACCLGLLITSSAIAKPRESTTRGRYVLRTTGEVKPVFTPTRDGELWLPTCGEESAATLADALYNVDYSGHEVHVQGAPWKLHIASPSDRSTYKHSAQNPDTSKDVAIGIGFDRNGDRAHGSVFFVRADADNHFVCGDARELVGNYFPH
jgi:hypothetical protein